MRNSRVRVLFISISSLPLQIPSDKQFINDLVLNLPEDISPSIWTLNETVPCNTIVHMGKKDIYFRSVCRLGHKPWCSGNEGLVIHRHKPILNLSEIIMSILFASLGSLRKIINEQKPQILHFTDDLGPAIPIVKGLFPRLKITCSKPSVLNIVNKKNFLYSLRIRTGLIFADTIIAFTKACKDNLLKIGIKNNIEVIPWGVILPNVLSDFKIKRIRSEFGCSMDDILVVGSPRNLDKMLINAVKAGENATKNTNLHFLFCIKPTLYRKEFSKLSTQKVQVIKSPSNFYEILESADVLFAPQGSNNHTSLPYLLWLEAMVRGTPVVTEFNPGVEETIENKVSGILYNGFDSSQYKLKELCNKFLLRKMKQAAKKIACEKYNIKKIAARYAALWLSLKDYKHE